MRDARSSHALIGGRYVLVYHHQTGRIKAIPGEDLGDALKTRDRYNAENLAGGRWAIHELGPEVDEPDNPTEEET